MAVDLHLRAANQRDALALVATEVSDALAAARSELTLRLPDPSTLTVDDWRTQLGAAQHVDVARSALADSQEAETRLREGLAAIVNPADAQTFEEDLRDNLVEQGELRVELRAALERKAAAEDLVDRLNTLAADAETEIQSADAAVRWGKERQDHTSALTDLLNQPPLSDAQTGASGLLAAQEFQDAADRLSALLPAALLARAEARFDEAEAVAPGATQHAAGSRQAIESLTGAEQPLLNAVSVARRSYDDAEDALTEYVNSTPGTLSRAPEVLGAVAGQPDLSPAQSAALNPADPSPFETAISREGDLAAALAQLTDAKRALDDANLGVLMGDPAADPAAAQAALQNIETNVVAPARSAYDDATRTTLDEWEVEVPPSLWTAVRDFVRVRGHLTRIADGDTVTDLIAALDSAEDQLGDALDDHDDSVRQHLRLRLVDADRRSRETAAGTSTQERLIHYVRGDGPGGRTSEER